jgi:hypothetical protein
MNDRHDAPKDWPTASTSSQECPDLTGHYISSDQGSPEVPLAKWILPKTTYPLERVERVSFAGPTNGTLTVRLIEDPTADVVVRELKQGLAYRCDSGWLVLPVEGIVIPPFVYSSEARLARAADGSLVVEATEFGAGLAPYAPLVPVAKTGNKWHLYQTAPE